MRMESVSLSWKGLNKALFEARKGFACIGNSKRRKYGKLVRPLLLIKYQDWMNFL